MGDDGHVSDKIDTDVSISATVPTVLGTLGNHSSNSARPQRAALFPGQGSQGKDGPVDTAKQQPYVFDLSVASWEAAQIECDWFAGHSLGCYAALVAAGALGLDDTRTVVAARGQAMADAGEAAAGAMVALLGADVELATRTAEAANLQIANDNAPGQMVLSGPAENVDRLLADPPPDLQGVRLRRLQVSGAFHSELMRPAVAPLEKALAGVKFGDSSQVVSNATAVPYADPRTELVDALVSPVRWRETLLFLSSVGVTEFVEFEPSGVLSGLVKRTVPGATTVTATELSGVTA